MTCDVTYEELAAFAARDLGAEREQFLRAHAAECERCGQRLDALGKVDSSLRSLPRIEIPEQTMLSVRRALSRGIRAREPEVMTLQEVADFLRVTLEDLYETVDELPAFELAGRILVRRVKLLECIEHRENSYRRQVVQSDSARGVAPSTQRRFR